MISTIHNIILFVIFSFLCLMVYYYWYDWIKKKPINLTNKFLGEIKKYDEEKHKYYLNVILNIVGGNVKQSSKSICLMPVSYGYYRLDDLIVWYDDKIKTDLKLNGVASYVDSAKMLVLTIDSDRLKHVK